MTISSEDPKGYYAALGLTPKADAEAIKVAFRKKAKDLHPDRNPAADAGKRFNDLNEAYQTLSDPSKRTAYDKLAPPPKPEASPSKQSKKTKSRVHTPPDTALSSEFVACSTCGKVTAQPRYVVFEEVRGRVFKTLRTPIHGVFCNPCAERHALRATFVTWMQGWWAIPFGPIFTIAALVRNLFGGIKPKEANAKLLLQQTHAFLKKGDYEIARAVADQAQKYVHDAPSSRILNGLMVSLSNRPARKLKNKWPLFGRIFFVQSLPLAAAVLLIISAVILVPVFTHDAPAVAAKPPPVSVQRITVTPETLHHVAGDQVSLREGPARTHSILDQLARFSTVQTLDTPRPGDAWVRVIAPQGLIGYIHTDFLGNGPGWKARNQWCIENRGTRPENGTLLNSPPGGNHRLVVHNSLDQDALIKLRHSGGLTHLSMFVRAKETAEGRGFPDGSYRILFATGSAFSAPCAIFLNEMETLA